MSKWQSRLASCYVVSASGCWEWTGAVNADGYGLLRSPYGSRAHRASFFANNPSADRTLYVCHKCDNTRCINPSHLFLGTAADNFSDMVSKNRQKFVAQLRETDRAQVIELFRSGVRFTHICKSLKHSPAVVRKILVSEGLMKPRKRTQITSEMKKVWHLMRSSGVKVKDIARQLNVDISIVSTELNNPSV